MIPLEVTRVIEGSSHLDSGQLFHLDLLHSNPNTQGSCDCQRLVNYLNADKPYSMGHLIMDAGFHERNFVKPDVWSEPWRTVVKVYAMVRS